MLETVWFWGERFTFRAKWASVRVGSMPKHHRWADQGALGRETPDGMTAPQCPAFVSPLLLHTLTSPTPGSCSSSFTSGRVLMEWTDQPATPLQIFWDNPGASLARWERWRELELYLKFVSKWNSTKHFDSGALRLTTITVTHFNEEKETSIGF